MFSWKFKCHEWFAKFKKDEFDLEYKLYSGRPQGFVIDELQAQLDDELHLIFTEFQHWFCCWSTQWL